MNHNKQPSAGRLRSCYESAIKMLHIRASRRVTPLVVEHEESISTCSPPSEPLRFQSPMPTRDHADWPKIPTSVSANGVINKMLTRTKSTSRSLVTMASEKTSHYFSKLHHKHFRIFVKAPHFVAGGEVSGTVVVNLPQQHMIVPDALDGIESLTFRLVGVEDIHDYANYNPATHTYQFLEVPIFHYGQDVLAACYNHSGVLKIPFTIQLPVDLGASYADKKAWVRYQLQAEMTLDSSEAHGPRPIQRTIKTERSLLVYPNAIARPLSDATLYMPIHETRHIWQSPVLKARRSVELQVTLSRTIWIAGTPIYANLKINNQSKQKVSCLKLELLRRQNTFSQTGLSGSFGLMPVTSTCEVVTRVTSSNFDWWQPIEQNMLDQVTLAIQSPANHFSIRNQKLIDVSYSIRVSVSSVTSTDAVLEVPVILVHPISMDPPPGNYLHVENSSETKDTYRRLCVDIFREITPISNSSSESDVPSLEPTKANSRKSSMSSLSSIKPFRKMRRNISQWISQSNNKRSTVVTPVAQLSPVRHGNVRSPKQFGTQPDSIGDAGLDIRHKLNVATAREAWEGCTAERCSLPRITLISPPPERSVSLPPRWKAPSEKFEIGSSFDWHQQDQQCVKATPSRYPLNARKGIKRMLASSRYMKSLQSKTLSVAEDGRKLLALSTIQNGRQSAVAM
ncbi:hypothetical protein BJV82DRAFT_628776 [Fennellomyces sp. T-0311]|nr:hypothetical protein BJV82DRAFT_628776 [Fennellomyces sp. T-0311]